MISLVLMCWLDLVLQALPLHLESGSFFFQSCHISNFFVLIYLDFKLFTSSVQSYLLCSVYELYYIEFVNCITFFFGSYKPQFSFQRESVFYCAKIRKWD